MIIGLDPGPTKSAIVGLIDGDVVIAHQTMLNLELLDFLRRHVIKWNTDTLVIEQIAAMGMAVGEEVFETVFWSGRFAECWDTIAPWHRLKRHQIKMHLCGNMRAKDPNIRQALIDRFGGSEAIKKGGRLYGVKGDEWSALAVAVTYYDTKEKPTHEASARVAG